MATVNVTNWADFVTAVGVSGNTVVCPENAVWDMNEIAPEGVGRIDIACDEIKGNGLEIKNLVSTGGVYVNKSGGTTSVKAAVLISGLSITNILGSGGTTFSGTVGFIYVAVNNALTLRQCTISGLFSQVVHCPFLADATGSGRQGYIYLELCAVNVEMQGANGGLLRGYVIPKGSRFTLHLPTSTVELVCNGGAPSAEITNNEYVVNAPNMTSVDMQSCNASLLRGNLPLCTTIKGSGVSAVSIYNTDSVPNVATVAANITGVTDAQMRNASYLRSIGFMIGTG